MSSRAKGKQTSWEHTSLTGDFYFNLSLGNKISKYSKAAIADDLFVDSNGDSCHEIIKEIKSHNWYVQNPAIDRLNNQIVIASDDDCLFVLGRNIYQAACGDSGSAISFIVSA